MRIIGSNDLSPPLTGKVSVLLQGVYCARESRYKRKRIPAGYYLSQNGHFGKGPFWVNNTPSHDW